jgi:hypothetical protein
MRIRPAAMDDYDQLCELFDEVDALHRQTLPEIFRKAEGPPRSKERIAHLIAGPAQTILVCERDGRLLGLAVALEVPSSQVPSMFRAASLKSPPSWFGRPSAAMASVGR